MIHIGGLSKEEITQLFKNENRNFKVLEALLVNNLLEKFSNEFYSAYDDYMKEISRGEEEIPAEEFWDDMVDRLNGNKLRSTFTAIRDILINGGEVDEDMLYFFEKGLIKYGNLNKKPESSTLKIIIPMIESDKNFELFLNKSDLLMEILNSSIEHKETAVGELQLRYNSKEYGEDERMIVVAKAFNLQKNKKEE